MSEPLPFLTASTQTFCWAATTWTWPAGPVCRFAAGMVRAKADANRTPSGPTKIVPLGRCHGWPGSSFTTVMLPPAWVGFRFS
ncbi:MAG TPA: hypothetical protein VH642_02090 [Streptosporangiaceae bacterium]